MLIVLQVGKPHRYLGEANPIPTHKTLQNHSVRGRLGKIMGMRRIEVSGSALSQNMPRKKVTSGHLAATMSLFPLQGD